MKEELANLVRTFEALGPIVGHALKSGQLFEPRCELTEPDPDIRCEYDVKIPMSEGFSVTANIYRSKTAAEKGEQVPVVMCAPLQQSPHACAGKNAAGGRTAAVSADSAGWDTGVFQAHELGVPRSQLLGARRIRRRQYEPAGRRQQ